MGPIHPDAQEALDKLLAIGRAEQPLDEEEIAHAMDEEDAALIAIDQADLNSDNEDDIDNENDDLELNVALFAVFASQNQFF
jgi:hypothetical protein